MASAGELSFNWTGFLTAMASNLTFGFRAVWSKRWVGRRCCCCLLLLPATSEHPGPSALAPCSLTPRLIAQTA